MFKVPLFPVQSNFADCEKFDVRVSVGGRDGVMVFGNGSRVRDVKVRMGVVLVSSLNSPKNF